MNALSATERGHITADRSVFLQEALQGLRQSTRQLPCKYFYDERGSRLFEEICQLPEYYPTRTEMQILREGIDEMVAMIGPDCQLIEFGSGNSEKTRLLLDRLPGAAEYVPIDISREPLARAVAALREAYPGMRVTPVWGDYTQSFDLPECGVRRRVFFFPGSTIGNFTPREANRFLKQVAHHCAEGGGMLIGVDLKKDPAIISRAYNDARGITAEFNLNILRRCNRELDADFKLDRFAHHAFYNPVHGRIEMHLVSLEDQIVHVGGVEFAFKVGQSIWTENSYKYSLEEFSHLADETGLTVRQVWMDDNKYFSVQFLEKVQPDALCQ